MITEPSFTIGVEEEYLLVERDTRELVSAVPAPVLAEYRELLGEQVSPEFLQCQVEVGTRVCTTMPELREELVRLRRGVADVAERNGLAVVAASSHPFARRGFQQLTPRERYRILAEDMQEVARRLVISGMHVHVGIEDPEVRIDLLSQSSYVLPHLLALSTSSPFWEGADTGLKSYRIAVWDEMPRSGLPPGFESWSEYERHIGVLVDAGLIEDASKIWWDLRPSARFPTLEMRICDVCTRLEDALCLAALYRCWLRMMFRLRRGNQRWRTYRAFLLDENRWRAQRYGVDGSLIDFGRGELVAFGDLVEEMLELFAEDAAHFDCRKEVGHARTILRRGTSAHRQLAVYNDAVTRGAGHEEALRAVVDALVAETLADVPSATATEARRASLGALARDPDLLGGPSARPLERRDVGPLSRVAGLGGLQLEQVEHLEAVAAQHPDHVAVSEVELDRPVVLRPLEAAHPELGPLQQLRRRLGVPHAQDDEHRVRQEDQLAPRPQ